MPDSSPVATAAEELSRERDRVASRLRSMPLENIPENRVLAVGQALADLAATAAAERVRVVPRLAPYAAADQITVLTGEVLSAVHRSPAEGAALAEQARYLLADLRSSL
jgi:hypothetical protein